MNLPNALSMLRIVLIPIFIIMMSYGRQRMALGVFVLAAVTDALDGFFARRFGQKTTLGAYLDPIADKLLLVSSYVAFSLLQLIPRWLTILVVSRDVIISTGILILRLNAFQPEIKPTLLSKCTTFFQIVTIVLALLLAVGAGHIDMAGVHLHTRGLALPLACWATGVLTVASGLHYIYRGLRLIGVKGAGDGSV